MRRNWLTILLFALALAIQVVAPVAVNVALAAGAGAMTTAADGSSAASETCLKNGGSSDASTKQAPGHLKGHRDACLLCQAYCDGVAPLAGGASSIGRASADAMTLALAPADGVMRAAARDYGRQARAPPSNS